MVIPQVKILGIGISAINMEIALDTNDRWISTHEHRYICLTIVYNVMICQSDEKLRQIFNYASLEFPAGMPLVWLSRLKGFSQIARRRDPGLMIAAGELSAQ